MKTKKKALSFFAVVTLFSMTCSFAHPVTPSLFKQLQLADYMFGVALACMSFGNLLFSPFWGRMSSRMSSRSTMLICCLGYAVGQLLFAMSKTVAQVIVIRLFTGVFVGGIFVGMLTYIVNTAPDEKTRARYLVYQATLEAVFNAAGYFVGGMLGEISVQTAVITQACSLGLCAVLFRIVCVDDSRRVELPRGKELLREVNPLRAFIQGKPLLMCSMGLLLAVCSLQYFSQTCFDQSFNYYVIDQIQLSTGYNGAIKGSMGLVTLAANSTLCVWLMKKTDTKKSVAIVLAICGVTMSVALCITDLVPFLILNIIFFALSAISVPMLQDLVASAGKERKLDGSMVMSFYNALKNLGGILGALLAGFTYMVTPKTPFICCIAGLLIASAIAVVYRRKTMHTA